MPLDSFPCPDKILLLGYLGKKSINLAQSSSPQLLGCSPLQRAASAPAGNPSSLSDSTVQCLKRTASAISRVQLLTVQVESLTRRLSLSREDLPLVAMGPEKQAIRFCHGCHGPIDESHAGIRVGIELCTLPHHLGCRGGYDGRVVKGAKWTACPIDFVPLEIAGSESGELTEDELTEDGLKENLKVHGESMLGDTYYRDASQEDPDSLNGVKLLVTPSPSLQLAGPLEKMTELSKDDADDEYSDDSDYELEAEEEEIRKLRERVELAARNKSKEAALKRKMDRDRRREALAVERQNLILAELVILLLQLGLEADIRDQVGAIHLFLVHWEESTGTRRVSCRTWLVMVSV